MATYGQAKAILRIWAPRLLKYPNVVAVALGRKDGHSGWAIRVHVTRRTQKRTRRSVPRFLKPPRSRKWLVPVPTDVEQTGEFRLHQQQQFILHSGTGLEVQAEQGTCTAILTADGPTFYALTCGHVVSNNLTGMHNLPGGWLTGKGIQCSELNAPETLRQYIGSCVRCSSREAPIDLALIQLQAASRPQPSPYVTAIRDLSADRLRDNEPLRVLRRRTHKGVFDTVVPPTGDHYCTMPCTYPTDQGDVTVTYSGLICYCSASPNDALADGDSGSAVVDAQNRLVGIHIGSAINQQSQIGYGYAVSSNQLVAWAPACEVFRI